MAGKVLNLLNRDGRFFARLVIPKELRLFMDGKSELQTALGPDHRTALKRDEGDFAGQPSHPMLAQAKIEEPPPPAMRVAFRSIIDAEAKRRKRGKDAKPFLMLAIRSSIRPTR